MSSLGWVSGVTPIDRMLGWLMSLGGLFVLVTEIRRFGEQMTLFPVWWMVMSSTVVAQILFLAMLGRIVPMRLLRVFWTSARAGAGGTTHRLRSL